jgi:N-acetylglucosamine-6-phosphate deacetylase
MTWSQDMVKILTVAPELPGSEEIIELCAGHGVVPALGHTVASGDDIRRAADAGALLFTHLGNGIPNMLPRHPNTIWSVLAEDRLHVSLIADGHHLPEEFIRVVLAVKGRERTIVVSDGTHVSGMPPGSYPGFDGEIVLEEDGKLHDPARGCLAGSSAVLADCVAFLQTKGILDEESVRTVCAENPSRLVGIN